MRTGMFAYVTVGGLNEVQVFRTDDFSKVATIPVGKLPHGIWPSGDGTRVYVGLENADGARRHRHADQHGDRDHPDRPGAAGSTYVSNAVPDGDGTQNLAAARRRRQVAHFVACAGHGRQTGQRRPACRCSIKA